MDIAPVHIRRFASLRCHRFHRVNTVRGPFCTFKTVNEQLVCRDSQADMASKQV